ncbi:MAG: cytochrome c-type biogenesis protein [Acidimicrobiia bacterium]
MTRRLLPWLALGIIVVVALGVLVARSSPSDSTEARARRLEKRLACPVCTGESVAESNAPEARALRDDIRDRLESGQSDDEILNAYATVWGERVLLEPSDDGLGFVAWGIPVLALLAGAAGIGIALWRWTRQPRLAASGDDEVLVARARETSRAEEP